MKTIEPCYFGLLAQIKIKIWCLKYKNVDISVRREIWLTALQTDDKMTLDLITLKYDCFALSVSSQASEATVVRGGKEGLNNPRCALARLAYLERERES